MKAEFSGLSELLERQEKLLREHGEEHWASWLNQGAVLLKAGSLQGVRHILAAYGGMGSLNDLVITPQNGHLVDETDPDVSNGAVQQLSSDIHALASLIWDKRQILPSE